MKKTICIALLAIILAAAAGFYLWQRATTSQNIASTATNSAVVRVLHNSTYSGAIDDLNNGYYTKAYNQFVALAAAEKDPSVRQTLDLFAANAQTQSDPEQGVASYRAIYEDTGYSPVNRAFALLQVVTYSTMQRNYTYLQPFMDDPSTFGKTSTSTLLYLTNKKIYALYPLCIATTDIARYEVNAATSTAAASAVYAKYEDQITVGERETLASPGLQYLAANCFLHEYYLSTYLETYKLATPDQSEQLIKLAVSTAKQRSTRATQQMMSLEYANFLARVNRLDDSYAVLTRLDQEGILPPVTTNLSTAGSKSGFKYLYQASKKDARIAKWFKRFGW